MAYLPCQPAAQASRPLRANSSTFDRTGYGLNISGNIMLFISLLLVCAGSVVLSAPASISGARRRELTAVSSDQLSAFAPFTHLAGAAYCSSESIEAWTCGGECLESYPVEYLTLILPLSEHCDALPNFEPTLTGGDGNAVQRCRMPVLRSRLWSKCLHSFRRIFRTREFRNRRA